MRLSKAPCLCYVPDDAGPMEGTVAGTEQIGAIPARVLLTKTDQGDEREEIVVGTLWRKAKQSRKC